MLPSPERRQALDAGMCDQACATAELHVGSDHAIWPDFHIIGEHRAGIDARRVSNQSGHDRKAPLEREMRKRKTVLVVILLIGQRSPRDERCRRGREIPCRGLRRPALCARSSF